MIKIENVEVTGWEHAIRGMRNPMNSWDKSDSYYGCCESLNCDTCAWCDDGLSQQYYVGDNDLSLMKKLRNAGTDHRKFMRMITVYLDITAPLYWWKEFDTYKVGTVANSCSTMHKIQDKEFTLDDFSCEHLINTPIYVHDGLDMAEDRVIPDNVLNDTVELLNVCRRLYNATGDKSYWWQMIQLLPSSYNQKRTVMLNYEVLANMYKSRKNHKLDEWVEFCEWIKSLPYAELITGGDE